MVARLCLCVFGLRRAGRNRLTGCLGEPVSNNDLFVIPSRRPSRSWWTDPVVQADRARFDAVAEAEFRQRIQFSGIGRQVWAVDRSELQRKDEH